jgi:hypothetical protein
VNDLEKKLREILGDEIPVASFALRRPNGSAEVREWDDEGVIIIPPSLDFVIEEAIRRQSSSGANHISGPPTSAKLP